MFTEKFKEVVAKQGVVSIVSWAQNDAHVVNTWNSYLVFTGENKLVLPVYGMRKTQKNIDQNNKVKITLGSKEVMGYQSMGTGYLIEGTAKFFSEGEEFNMMKEKFSFPNRILEITVTSCKQTL